MREMDLAGRMGATRIAAPRRRGDNERISLTATAERYRARRVGVSLGIVPELELWGFSKVSPT